MFKYEMTIGFPNSRKKTKTISVDAPDYSTAWELAVNRLDEEFSEVNEFVSIEDFKNVA